MGNISITPPGAPQPPTRRSGSGPRTNLHRWLEAWVVKLNGTSKVERYERNDSHGQRAMDGWAMNRLQDADVDFVAVYPVERRTGSGGGYR